MTTIEQLESFYAFAYQSIRDRGESTALDELLLRWYDFQRQDEIQSAIEQGLREVDAGLGRPASEFLAEFRQKNDIPKAAE